MTREDIIRMAQACWPSDRRMWSVDADLPRLERFAALVAAAAIAAIKEALAQPEERNFCPRCGKRTADLTTIHTCTPPRGQA